MLFAELAGFTYTYNLLLGKCQEFDDDSFRLHSFELLEIDMGDSFVPSLYVSVSFMALGSSSRVRHILSVVEVVHMELPLVVSSLAKSTSSSIVAPSSSIQTSIEHLFVYCIAFFSDVIFFDQ